MKGACIGVIAAMPEEIKPLLRRVKTYRKEKKGGFTFYTFELEARCVVLVESGMGPLNAAAATETLIAEAGPRVILNFGFGGAVLPGLEVGDLVLADRVLFLKDGRVADVLLPDSFLAGKISTAGATAGLSLRTGTFLTAATIMNKEEVARTLSSRVETPVLEMESAAIMRVAARAGIPAAAVRGISDPADLELGFSLEEFCDSELRLRLPKILACVARRPKIIPQLMQLAANSKKAGEALAVFVEAAIRTI